MFSRILAATAESFLLLRRQKIFLATFLIALIAFSFVNMSSNWGNMEWEKILFYFSAFVYITLGVLVAIIWASQMLKSGDGQTSQDIPLASALTRSEYLISRFLAIFLALSLIAAVFLCIIQVNMLANNYSWFTPRQLLVFFFLTWIWWLMAALTIFLRTICSATLTMILSLILFVVGMITKTLELAQNPDSSWLEKTLLAVAAKVWNLQHFNLTETLFMDSVVTKEHLYVITAYGSLAILVLLASSVLTFRRMDL